ncbi:hypothetical protein EBR57_05045, partial [bacterium]|nr:hypothetical protein [bacterium]
RLALEGLPPKIIHDYFNMTDIPNVDPSDSDKFKFFPPVKSLTENLAEVARPESLPKESDYRRRFYEASDLQRRLFGAMIRTEDNPLLHPFYVGDKYKQYVPMIRIHNPKFSGNHEENRFYDVVSTEGGLFARPSESSVWYHALGYTPETGLVIHPSSETSYGNHYPRISNIAEWLNDNIGGLGQKSNAFYEFTRGSEEEKNFISNLGYNVKGHASFSTPDTLWRAFNELEKSQRGVALGTHLSASSSLLPLQAAQEAWNHFLAMGPHGGQDPRFHAGIWPSAGEHAAFWEPHVSGAWAHDVTARKILSQKLAPQVKPRILTTLDDYGNALFSESSPYNSSDMVLVIPATEGQALEYAKNGIPKERMPTARQGTRGSRLIRMEELREQLARPMDAQGNPTSNYNTDVFFHPLLQTSSEDQPTHFVIAHIPREQAVMRQGFRGVGYNNNLGTPPIHNSRIVAQIPIGSIPKAETVSATEYLPNATEPSKMIRYDAG